MCGIAGKINFNQRKIVDTEIKSMTDALQHRGPDDAGIYTDGQIGLGHRRLSIIDLSSAGHQPMSDGEETIWITFNGEIYNFAELKKELEHDGIKFKSHTDTEVIIYLYKKYGKGCLTRLRGMFAFALWDSTKKELLLARDRLGKKPLKYYLDKTTFIFASELKAILKNPEVHKEIDYVAIDEYLTYNYIPHPRTGFKNIWKLPPGHLALVKSNGDIEIEKYWELDFTKKQSLSTESWEKLVTSKLQESVRLRLVADVPLGIHLSGGIDSGLITALAAHETPNQKLQTFSIGFKEKKYNELPFAKLIAEKYHTDHHEFIIEPDVSDVLGQIVYQYEEPFADSSILPTWYLSELTRKQVTVALNGDGGDENFAGYQRYNGMAVFNYLKLIPGKQVYANLFRTLNQLTKFPLFKKIEKYISYLNHDQSEYYFKLIDFFGQEIKKGLYTDTFKNLTTNVYTNNFLKTTYHQTKAYHWLDKLLSTDIASYLPDDLLVKVDIASMAHGLEIRSPFLDHEFMALTATIPAHLKLRGFTKKYLLKKIALHYLPKECVMRPKQGFGAPLEYWFKGSLHTFATKKLLSPTFKNFDLFTNSGLTTVLEGNNTNRLWALLILEEWLSQNFS